MVRNEVAKGELGMVRSKEMAKEEPGMMRSQEMAKEEPGMVRNELVELKGDGAIAASAGEERLVLEGGLQPFLLRTASGALVLQAQLPEKPYPSERMVFHSKIATVISHDGGMTWERFERRPGENDVNMEGGAIQLAAGSILALDTYITPVPGKPDAGAGELYVSIDDWRSLEGPVPVTFHMPGAVFTGSTDDGGEAHQAQRLHRSIVALPGGDLLACGYGWLQGDTEPAPYMTTMKKSRTLMFRSRNMGKHWELVSTIDLSPKPGTEGLVEPALVRLSGGRREGRLLCMIRTGRELYEAHSDDDGATWSAARPVDFGVVDIYREEEWADMFAGMLDKHGKPVELTGAFVDPELLELRSGALVCAFGVRIPARACWPKPDHPWNGNYLAVSLDQGETWSHVYRLTSGVLTTHYMAIAEIADNELFVAYDFGDWENKRGRYTYGRTVKFDIRR